MKGVYLRNVSIGRILPPHGVNLSDNEDFSLCVDLIKSMKKNGWNRRPLLGFRRGDKIKCITGSHRYFAAKRVGIKKIPVYIITEDAANKIGFNRQKDQNLCEIFYQSKQCREKGFAGIQTFVERDWR